MLSKFFNAACVTAIKKGLENLHKLQVFTFQTQTTTCLWRMMAQLNKYWALVTVQPKDCIAFTNCLDGNKKSESCSFMFLSCY